MSLQVGERIQAEQGVKQSGVTEIDLGGLDLPFLDVLVPGLKDTDHIGPVQDIEVPAAGHTREPQRSGQLRGVPDLAVRVGQHGPEPAELGRGRFNAEAP